MPPVGWPANGSSRPGVKMRTFLAARGSVGGSTKTVSERLNSRAIFWNCDSGIYAETNGDAARLPNGNTIHVIGTSSHIREYKPDCTVVWEIEFEYGSGDGYNIGRSELLADLYTIVSPQYRAE